MALRTRTLAGLYLAQGHPAKALEMIERLLAERPGDARLVQMRADAKRQLTEGVSPEPQGEEAPETFETGSEVRKEPRASFSEKVPGNVENAQSSGQATIAPRPVVMGTSDERVEVHKPKMADRTLAFFIERTSRLITAVMERRRR